jgi:tetratricopeptide (TPR) repeat protein
MKKKLRLLWILFPLLVITFHFGQGRRIEYHESANILRDAGLAAEKAGKYDLALRRFSEALTKAAGADPSLRIRLQLDTARVRIQQGDSFEVADALDQMLQSPEAENVPKSLMREARSLAAEAHYYAGYALRLENAGRDLWMDELERARQHLRALSENAIQRGAAEDADAYGRNLESAIRLERSSMYELLGKNVPAPCEGCRKKGVFKKKCDKCNGKKPGEKPEEEPSNKKGRSKYDPGIGS